MSLKFLAGRTIEQQVIRQLQERYAIIPIANILVDGPHGPQMEGDGVSVTLPDAQFYGAERGGWLEVKSKSDIMCFEKWDNRLEHGIDKEKFQAYCIVQLRTEMPVYLLIVEMSTGKLLMADLNTLRSSGRPRSGQWPDGKPSVNWDRGVFAEIGMFVVPNGDLTKLKITWNQNTLNSFLSQLELGV